ncbi:GNAT family N-acetyltransferase [Adhaeretor mobilis]|uniref:GNAT family N-acetyltransferase n=1 Tax=Adhaeretor mobilis TaxID=1930276 RepID=UPI001C54C63B|nr:GNAT family N-acetyltransferase [Adhaeretor mobilis]
MRSADEHDAAPLKELVKTMLADGNGQVRLLEVNSATKEDELGAIVNHRDDPNCLFLIAEPDQKVVGCLHFAGSPLSRLAHRGIFGMGVAPQWRGQGVGRQLLQTFLAWAELNPMLEKICLAVVANNARAIALYKKLGFQEEGPTRDSR